MRQLPKPGRLSVEDQFTELMKRPDVDAARARQTQMLREMREANRYGFRPNPNAASLLHDGVGGQVDLITGGQTYLRSSTGCHLEPAAKVRGRPIAVEHG